MTDAVSRSGSQIARNEGLPPLIAALTDYGAGPYAALLEASARYPSAPMATWLDLSQTVPLGDIRAGALILRRTVPHLPPCVCVAVVDPGVGTERRAVAVATASGHRFVGPDNGLLEPAVRRLGGPVALVNLGASPLLRVPSSSRTFDGRDLFGPVAGALAAGATLHDVGEDADPASLVALALPAPQVAGEVLDAAVLEIDHFGTLVLALDDQLGGLEPLLLPGREGEVRLAGGGTHELAVGHTFADVGHGDLVLYLDSDGALALARRDGSAAAMLGVSSGDTLTINLSSDDPSAPEAA